MDQPQLHITSGLMPRSDNKPGLSPHPGLSFRVAALLKGRHLKLREQGNNAIADALAVLGASAAAASLERDCERRSSCTGDYLRPTIDALLWRDPQLRRLLRAVDAHKLPAFRCAACDENTWRACIVVEILSELAKMTTQPDARAVAKVAGRARAAVKEWQTAEALRAFGLLDDAAGRTQRALFHFWCAQKLAREWTPDRDELLRVTSWRLTRHFGFRGDRIAAACQRHWG